MQKQADEIILTSSKETDFFMEPAGVCEIKCSIAA